MSNPLTDVHKAFVADLIAKPAVSRFFRVNYEDNVTARGTKTPDVKTESNLPWLAIVPVGGECAINNATNLATIFLGFRIQIISGDKRFSELYESLFALFAALTTIERDGSDTLRALTWNGSRVVRELRCDQIDLARFSATENVEAITGTTSVAQVTVICDFQQSDLVTHAQT